MKTTVKRKDLLETVKTAARFADKHANMPILNQIELRFEKSGTIRVRSTDLESEYVNNLMGGLVVEETDAVTLYLDKKKLMESIKNLDTEDVTLEATQGIQAPVATCPSCGSEDFNEVRPEDQEPLAELANPLDYDELQCQACGEVNKTESFKHDGTPSVLKIGDYFEIVSRFDEDECPAVVEKPEGATHLLYATVEQIRRVLPAVTEEDSGFKLNGVKFDESLLVATDGHRLHAVKTGQVVSNPFVLSGAFLSKVVASLRNHTEIAFSMDLTPNPAPNVSGLKKPALLELYLKMSGETLPETSKITEIKAAISELDTGTTAGEHVFLESTGFKVSARKMESVFPDYKSILKYKEGRDVSCTVKSNVMKEALRQSMALTSTGDNPLRMSFNGSIDMEADTQDGDRFARASVPIESGGVEPAMTFGFNARYVLQIMDFFKDEELDITVLSSSKPMFISHEESGFEALVMPLRVQ